MWSVLPLNTNISLKAWELVNAYKYFLLPKRFYTTQSANRKQSRYQCSKQQAALGLGALEQISSVAGAKCGDPRHCSCWDPRDCRPALSISQQYLTGTHCISHHLHTSQQWTSQHMSLPHCSKYFNVFNINLHYLQYLPMSTLSVTILLSEHSSWYLPWPH